MFYTKWRRLAASRKNHGCTASYARLGESALHHLRSHISDRLVCGHVSSLDYCGTCPDTDPARPADQRRKLDYSRRRRKVDRTLASNAGCVCATLSWVLKRKASYVRVHGVPDVRRPLVNARREGSADDQFASAIGLHNLDIVDAPCRVRGRGGGIPVPSSDYHNTDNNEQQYDFNRCD